MVRSEENQMRMVFSVQLLPRREGRGRVAVLSILMLVLVCSIALVGSYQSSAGIATTSADGTEGEASILSRLSGSRDAAARAGSLLRLSTGEEPSWRGLQGRTGARARAFTSEQMQMMQMQENAAKTEAAVGLMEHVLGITNPQILAGMPKQLQDMVFQSAIHAVAAANAEQRHAPPQQGDALSSLSREMSAQSALAKILASEGSKGKLNAEKMVAAAQQLQQASNQGSRSAVHQGPGQLPSLQPQYPGLPQSDQQQLQEGEDVAQQAAAAQAAYAQQQQQQQQQQQVAPTAPVYAEAPEQEYTYPAAQAAAPVPVPGPVDVEEDAQPEASEGVVGSRQQRSRWEVEPHPNLDAEIYSDDTKALQLLGMAVAIILVPCCVCGLMGRLCCPGWRQNKSGEGGAGTRGDKMSPKVRETMPPARGLDDYDERSQMTGGDSSASLMPGSLRFLQRGLDSLQEGIGDLADTAIHVAAAGPFLPYEEDHSPYTVVVSFSRDANGCMGMQAATEIYEQCSARGMKTLLLPSDADWEKGTEHDTQSLAHVASCKLFVALVDDEWVQEAAHLRLLSVAVQAQQVGAAPRVFLIHDKDFQYKEDIALRSFKLGSSNSCSVRRSDSPLMPYELLDRIYGSKGYWHDMMQADPPDRDLGLTQEELAAVQGGALPLEARLKSQVSRRRGILQASEAAIQSGRSSGGAGVGVAGASSQPMILPTFTRPDIRFDPYIH